MTNEEYLKRLHALFAAIPDTLDNRVWIREVRDLILGLYDDIDYVVINVNLTLNLSGRKGVSTRQILEESIDAEGTRKKARISTRTKSTARSKSRSKKVDNEPNWRSLIESGKGMQFPFENYLEPVGFDMFTSDGQHAGAVLLFRTRGKPPISEETLERIELLKPLLVHLIMYHVSRRLVSNPIEEAWPTLIERIAGDAELTKREQQVLVLLFSSDTYEDIAEQLNISFSTVHTHVNNIYRKVGSSSLKELIVRWLTPRV